VLVSDRRTCLLTNTSERASPYIKRQRVTRTASWAGRRERPHVKRCWSARHQPRRRARLIGVAPTGEYRASWRKSTKRPWEYVRRRSRGGLDPVTHACPARADRWPGRARVASRAGFHRSSAGRIGRWRAAADTVVSADQGLSSPGYCAMPMIN